MENAAEMNIERTCAYCLTVGTNGKVKVCAGCRRRAYCSKECQQADWFSGQMHRKWCELGCGEEDLDWKVAPIPGKGLGLIAKRLIPAKFQIMVDAIRSEKHPRVQDLMPLNGSTKDKVAFNGLADRFGNTVLCLRIALANHDCHANADHNHDEGTRVKVLFAVRDIQMGEEICINYARLDDPDNPRSPYRTRAILEGKWGIRCPENCYCWNKNVLKLLTEARELDASIPHLAATGRVSEAMETVEKLLKIRESMQASFILMKRTFYDGFTVGILQKKTMEQGQEYIRRAFEISANIVSNPDSPQSLKYEKYMKDPSKHPSFLMEEPNPTEDEPSRFRPIL